jgi:hypothetical protein
MQARIFFRVEVLRRGREREEEGVRDPASERRGEERRGREEGREGERERESKRGGE